MALSDRNNPLISIITVVFNGVTYLEESINSVISIPFNDREYIVIDGGSTDGSLDIIKKYESEIDKWISEPDQGIYDAMNKGIRMANGQVIGILNSDDLLNEGVLEQVTQAFNLNPELDYVYGHVERITKRGTVYGIADSLSQTELPVKKYQQIPIPHGALFVKKGLFDELGYYDTAYIINSDYDFILKMIRSKKKGLKMDLAVSRYRDGGKSSGYLTFWERRLLLKKHGVSLFRREMIVLKSMIKLLISRLLPKPAFTRFRNFVK